MIKKIVIVFVFSLLLSSCQKATPTETVSQPDSISTSMETTVTAVTPLETTPAYLNASLSSSERAEDLLARMTLAEKIGQMTLIEKNSLPTEAVTQYFIGGVLSGGGGAPYNNTPENWAKMVDDYQKAALETPLGIPVIYGVDAVHGHNNVKDAVIFPHNIGLGAAGDEDLVFRVARATAEEMIATNIRWNYAPVIAVPQDIRWGRTYEGFGEDTDLVSRLGVAYLKGLQGDSLADFESVLGTPKHFIGDGGTTWGTSTASNYQIDQGDMQVDETTLRDLYLPPYQAAVDAGAQSIMVSFSSWNGTKMHAERYLLTDILKGELGFEGFLVSDWEAIDQIDTNYYTAVVTSINAGVDMNMVPVQYKRFIDTLSLAVEKGDVTEDRINDAVFRILKVKFDMGLFEHPFSDPEWLDQIGTQAHRDLAREAVARSLVLLKNEKNTLPIEKDSGTIFLAGDAADSIGLQCGGWTLAWQGGSNIKTTGTTIKDAFLAGNPDSVYYNRFGKFDNAFDANGKLLIADVGVVVLGEQPYAEGVGDQADLALTQKDADLINRVAERSQTVVVILLSGRPLVIGDYLDLADAWVAAWLPGTEGAGITDVLFGDKPFTGKTPYSWPLNNAQLPINKNIQFPADTCSQPLFPFGYGLANDESISVVAPICP
ncbi:MAG: glycoside hydrolase family 3 C-terminal domain-containing protein [Anaerolineaceae bacterium]|nr:glycoside hydrolase family 3 C-terminal domain-containing protein [Anaerolineaceae bacterium]